MNKKWVVKNIEVENISSEASPIVNGLGPLVRDVLISRGIVEDSVVRDFFNSDNLHDSFLMKDMEKACEIIKEKLENGEKITVYGDYDCDGVTSTVMLHNYLTALGGEVDWYIPSRDEGYGLNSEEIGRASCRERV